ncbi:MAG TPA: hypothetical protein VJO52_09850 [Gemmatimonadaceae bacterium]|nr:hypothetical protein [Gemmatimonadaceae bacterium]
MGGRKKPTTESRARRSAKAYEAPAGRPARVNEPTLAIRRKNFDLDQRRLDQLRAALGAKTERDAIIGAMDIALDVLAFERELGVGAEALFGGGGFRDVFDAADALDFGGFAAGARRPIR